MRQRRLNHLLRRIFAVAEVGVGMDAGTEERFHIITTCLVVCSIVPCPLSIVYGKPIVETVQISTLFFDAVTNLSRFVFISVTGRSRFFPDFGVR